MADSNIAVQPAGQTTATPPVNFELVTMVNAAGITALVQAVTIVDEQGRPVKFMTEETGQGILQAIKAMHATLANSTGELLPSTRGFSPQ